MIELPPPPQLNIQHSRFFADYIYDVFILTLTQFVGNTWKQTKIMKGKSTQFKIVNINDNNIKDLDIFVAFLFYYQWIWVWF